MSKRLELLRKYLSESPDDPFLHFAIAKEYEKVMDFEKALKKYTFIYEKFSDYVGNYYHFGKLLQHYERITEAEEIFSKGIEVASLAGDNHAALELKAARMEISDE